MMSPAAAPEAAAAPLTDSKDSEMLSIAEVASRVLVLCSADIVVVTAAARLLRHFVTSTPRE
jgi:hypothetical protein